eukprot:161634_1
MRASDSISQFSIGTFVHLENKAKYGMIESGEADNQYQILDLQEYSSKIVNKNILSAIEDDLSAQDAQSKYKIYCEHVENLYNSLFGKSLVPHEVEAGLFISKYDHNNQSINDNEYIYDKVHQQDRLSEG